MTRASLICLLPLVLLVAACHTTPTKPFEESARPHANHSQALYNRVTNWFDDAILLKPAEKYSEELSAKFAPLVLQEWAPALVATSQPFGTLAPPAQDPMVEPTPPTVYFLVDAVSIGGRSHSRFTYLWCYPEKPGGTKPSSLPLQGVRVTLNSRGAPVIWETLAARTSMKVLFVSRSLEMASAAQHGVPLPHRRFSIERATEETPNVIVARVLDDGPIPMGPIVYVDARHRDVTTVICRCMAAQAKSASRTSTYELVPLDAQVEHLLEQFRARAGLSTAFWPSQTQADAGSLETLLRLPETF